MPPGAVKRVLVSAVAANIFVSAAANCFAQSIDQLIDDPPTQAPAAPPQIPLVTQSDTKSETPPEARQQTVPDTKTEPQTQKPADTEHPGIPQDSTNVPRDPDTIPDDQKTPSEICRPEDIGDGFLDSVHSNLYKITCTSISWFDGLFGDRRYAQEYRKTNGMVTVGTIWNQRNGFDKLLRFRIHVYLPQMNERFHAFIGRSNRDEFVSEARSELYSLPNQFNRGTDDDVFLGLGYNEPMSKHGSFSADTGVGLQFPLDPYVRGSYRFARPIGEDNIIRFRESIFWENIEGFGTTAVVDWDHAVNKQTLLRWTNSGTWSQNSYGLRWYSILTLFHTMDFDRAIAYEVAANGRTDLIVPLEDYGVAAIYRQRVWRDYLIIELRLGMDWPQPVPTEFRRSNLNAGLAFELRYGRR